MKLKRLIIPLPYRRLVIAFVAGFCVMVFELVAARVMSPVVGASTYVWASIIGVIIAAMSLGYWLGGVLADARSRDGDVAWLLLGAALLMLTELCHTTIYCSGWRSCRSIFACKLQWRQASFLLRPAWSWEQ